MNFPNEVRIIGGKWRGRKIKVAAKQNIRPTPNIVRETLFNWLAPVIEGASCLDLFAGSGALGFEALSRGAKQVVMVDKSPQVIKTLKNNADLLATTDIEFIRAELSPRWPKLCSQQFNLVFLDPPFYQNLLAPCCQWLEQNNYLQTEALIYIEAESKLQPLIVPNSWQLYRHKTTGQVGYYLFQK